jgi:signal transduction histidine kinase
MGLPGPAYDAEAMNTNIAAAAPVRAGRTAVASRSWAGDLGYLLAGLPIGIPAFAVAVAGFALGLGTLVIWIGLPVLVGVLAAARAFARLERRRVEAVTGAALPAHHYRPASGSGIGRLGRALRDPQSWRDLVHMVVAFPLRVVSFAVTVALVVGGAGGLVYALWEWALPRSPDNHTLIELAFGVHSRLADILSVTGIGAVLLLLSPVVMRGLTALQTGLARGLLTSRTAALRASAEVLADQRRAAVQAEAQTLRRVERDIHDGPQQRLVRLNMDLEAAARRLDDDPERARPLVAEALAQSREALTELRAVSRGIAPPILADRGLGPALAAAAARCPVDVSLDIAGAGLDRGQRLAEAVENTAYFVVAEALTNVAKHSGARQCTVTVARDGERVRVTVVDDGRGGAHVGKGHGLAGLTDRVAAVGGRLDLDSPVGGPTVLRAEIPLAGLDGRQ